MRNLIFIMALVFLTMTLIMCAGEQKQEAQPESKQTTVTKEELIDCPGCNMKMEKSKMIAHVADGDTLYFCAEGCKDHYLAKLEKEATKKN